MALSLYDIKKVLRPNRDTDPIDDFRILNSWVEYEENHQKPQGKRRLNYLCYELEVLNPRTNQRQRLFKAIRFARVIRLPAGANQSTSFMDMQQDVLTTVSENGFNLITIIANIIRPVALGLLYLYGVQATGNTIEEAKEKTRYDFLGFVHSMQGEFAVLEMRVANAEEIEWLKDKMFSMEYMTMVRGIPKANKSGVDIGNKGIGGSNVNPDSQGTLENIILGMVDYEYVIEILSTPVFKDSLIGWQRENQKLMTMWYSQLQGSKSISMNLSLPMTYGANMSSSQGWNKGYSDSTTESYSQGQSFGQSEGRNVGRSLSESFGRSIGHSVGRSQGISISNGLTTSRGVSVGQSVSQSMNMSHGISQNQNQGISQNVGHGTNRGAGMSLSENQGLSQNVSASRSQGLSQGSSYGLSKGHTEGLSHNQGFSHNIGYSDSESVSRSNSASVSQSASSSASKSFSDSYSNSHGVSSGASGSTSHGQSHSDSSGSSASKSTNNGVHVGGNASIPIIGGLGINGSHSHSNGSSNGTSQSSSDGYSDSSSLGWSNGKSASMGHSSGVSAGSSVSVGNSTSQGVSIGESLSHGKNEGWGTNESYGTSASDSLSQNWGTSISNSQSQSLGQSVGMSNSYGKGLSMSAGESDSESMGASASMGSGVSDSFGMGISRGQTYSESQSISQSQTLGQSLGQTVSDSVSESASTGIGESYGESQSVSNSSSFSNSNGTSRGTSSGTSGGVSHGTSTAMGLGPSIGYSKSYQWLDQEVKDLLELLDFRNERYKKALRGEGMFYTYVYIACPSMDALSAAQAVAKTTWQNEYAMVEPLQVLNLNEVEQKHLLYHFSGFSADVTEVDIFGHSEQKYCTKLLPEEYVAYTHLPRVSEGGVYSIVQDIPKFSVPSRMEGEIYMGTIMSAERFSFENGYLTPYDYRLDEASLLHGFFTGASRSGKTVAAMRFVKELAHVRRKKTGKRMRIVVMDPKQDWRGLARYVEPERFKFYSMGNLNFHPVKINPWKIPQGVWPQHWIDGVIDIYCRSYGLLERGKQMLGDVIYELYDEAGVMDACDKPNWKESKKIAECSAKVNFASIYQRMFDKKAALEDPKNKGGRAGNDTRDAYARLLDRLSCFNRPYSIENRLYGSSEGMGIDELIGADDVTVLESKGLDKTFSNFIFGVITSGFYRFALAHDGGYLAEDQYETVLIVEEANEVLIGSDSSAGGQNASLTGESEFEQILDQSAGYGLFIFAITQKISMMPTSIIANSGLIFAGRLERPEDVTAVVRAVGREERIDDRDLVKWFPRSPIGQFVCKSARGFDFKEAEPVLVQIARLNTDPPSNLELEEILMKRDIDMILKKEA